MSNLKFQVQRRFPDGRVKILAAADLVAHIERNFPEVHTCLTGFRAGNGSESKAKTVELTAEQFLLISLLGKEISGNAAILLPDSTYFNS